MSIWTTTNTQLVVLELVFTPQKKFQKCSKKYFSKQNIPDSIFIVVSIYYII